MAALYSKTLYTPPAPIMESGQTVVQLTLLPAVAGRAVAPEPQTSRVEPESEPEPTIQPHSEPEPEPQKVEEPAAVNSEEQDASPVEDKGVITTAHATAPITPSYPRISRLRGEEGDVVLSVQVLASGHPEKIQVTQSSGYKRLDAAAIKAVQTASFKPARKLGQPVDSETEITITFRLTND